MDFFLSSRNPQGERASSLKDGAIEEKYPLRPLRTVMIGGHDPPGRKRHGIMIS
jgi:hypothetical protein